MKKNVFWDIKDKPSQRIIAGIISVIFVAIGLWAFVDIISGKGASENVDLKFPIASIGFGLMFLVFALKGKLF